MSELNSTFRVDEPVFKWTKNAAASPIRSQKKVKILKVVANNTATPCRAQRIPVSATPGKATGVTMAKASCGPRRVPVTQTSATPSTGNRNLTAVSVASVGPGRVLVTQATPCRTQNSTRHTIYGTPSAGNVMRKDVGAASVGPSRVPATQATPYHDPNWLKHTIYATPSTGGENRAAVSIASARRTLPPPQRVLVSEAKSGKSLTKSRTDKVQKLLDFEEEDARQ